MLKPHIQSVVEGRALARDEARGAMETIMNGEASPAQIGSFLTALRMRGETDEELAGFAEVMRSKAVRVPLDIDEPIIDTCGTGGDASHSFNISTTAAFVVAGAGVKVAKHGNRAMTSRCGSADVLEGLGVTIELAPEQVAECVDRVGIGFMYAPAFHPAMRFAGPVRREIGIRTVFNLLGPITNPAGARHQVIGVPNIEAASRLARVLGLLGSRHALVVHAHEGLDELGVSGPSTIAEMVMRESAWVTSYEVTPEQYGLERHEASQIRGGNVADNVQIVRDILAGERGAKRSIVLLNAAAALYAADAVPNITAGVAMAADSIDTGAATERLNELVSLTARMLARSEQAVA
ncbi:MAG TPA: anthranilate phosphoribosyltransferase [Thermomicrobiales bacterium]|nr:anthranilate phosphoribosyltransferase [Thermomicrobiales bacterium]